PAIESMRSKAADFKRLPCPDERKHPGTLISRIRAIAGKEKVADRARPKDILLLAPRSLYREPGKHNSGLPSSPSRCVFQPSNFSEQQLEAEPARPKLPNKPGGLNIF